MEIPSGLNVKDVVSKISVRSSLHPFSHKDEMEDEFARILCRGYSASRFSGSWSVVGGRCDPVDSPWDAITLEAYVLLRGESENMAPLSKKSSLLLSGHGRQVCQESGKVEFLAQEYYRQSLEPTLRKDVVIYCRVEAKTNWRVVRGAGKLEEGELLCQIHTQPREWMVAVEVNSVGCLPFYTHSWMSASPLEVAAETRRQMLCRLDWE